MTEILFDLVDNFQKYKYDDRFCDALASFFNIGETCCAFDKLSCTLSHNSYYELPKGEDLIPKNRGRIFIRDSHKDFILEFQKYHMLKSPILSSHKNFASSFQQHFILESYDYFIFTGKFELLKYSLINDDNYSLSWYLLLNADFRFIRNQFNDLKEIEKNVNQKNDKQDTSKIFYDLGLLFKYKKDDTKEKLSQIFSNYSKLLSTISTRYIELLKAKRNESKESDKVKEELKQLFRPLQDVLKIKYYIANHDGINNEFIQNLHFIDNLDRKHCERNLFDQKDYQGNFIGISKLCCGYCHHHLGEDAKNHRGTHGVIDWKWESNYDKKEIEEYGEKNSSNSIKPDYTEKFCTEVVEIRKNLEKNLKHIDNPPLQHRRLSFDDFEQNIQLPDFIKSVFFDSESEIVTLAQLKLDFDLLEGLLPVDNSSNSQELPSQ